MEHRTPVAADLRGGRATVFRCDLADPRTLTAACAGADAVVHFAGVLFAPRPEAFLPVTNFLYARHLVDAAAAAGVKRFILVSFPHVEGPTSRESPCTDRQDRVPVSVHARTRLEAERYLFRRGREAGMRAISLRPGMIYGRDVLMIAFARRLASRRLLAVWREPTPVHLLSIDDFNACGRAAVEEGPAEGTYPLGDDDPTTLQEFLDACCSRWGLPRPWRVPLWSVYAAAWGCERAAQILGTRTPFTTDFIRIGRVPYFCDTRRMKAHLLPRLKHPSWREGLGIL
jgi:nucleoside-diphosphate-sugar epimerase